MRPLNETLKQLREQAGLKQTETAAWLTKHFKPTKGRAVSAWETGDAIPSSEYLLYLIQLYDVVDVQEVFLGRSSLNGVGLQKLQEYTRLLAESPRYTEKAPRPKLRQLRFYDIPVSAGHGQFLDSDRCEWREVDDSVPADADYSVWVSGDSVEPRFIDRQWIYVREQESLNPGEIGIFLYDGESYCKVLDYEGGQPVLISLNPKYAPIVVTMADELRVMGKVVG